MWLVCPETAHRVVVVVVRQSVRGLSMVRCDFIFFSSILNKHFFTAAYIVEPRPVLTYVHKFWRSGCCAGDWTFRSVIIAVWILIIVKYVQSLTDSSINSTHCCINLPKETTRWMYFCSKVYSIYTSEYIHYSIQHIHTHTHIYIQISIIVYTVHIW